MVKRSVILSSIMGQKNLITSYKRISILGISNFVEYFDLGIFVFMLPQLTNAFFPETKSFAPYIQGFLMVSITYLARPIGAIIFGYIGDVHGRKLALLSSILLLSAINFIIFFLPTYNQVGLISTLLLILFRILQGISLGGESFGIILLASETNNFSQTPLFLSLITSLGLLGWIVSLYCTNLLSDISINLPYESWRYPFLIASTAGLFCFSLRLKVLDSYEINNNIHYSQQTRKITTILKGIYNNHLKDCLIFVGLVATLGAYFYYFCIGVKIYLAKISLADQQVAYNLANYALFTYMFFLPISGWITCKTNPIKLIKYVLLLAIIASPILVFNMFSAVFVSSACAAIISGIIMAFYMSPMLSIVSGIFPKSIAYTAGSICYNLAFSFVGGIVPSTMYFLETEYPGIASSSYLLCIACIISITSIFQLSFKIKNGTKQESNSSV